MLDKVTWPLVTLVVAVLAAVVALSWLHTDVTVITNVLIALGLGGGLGVLSGIKNNVNGNLSELVRLIGDAVDKLAKSQPIRPQPLHSEDKDGR